MSGNVANEIRRCFGFGLKGLDHSWPEALPLIDDVAHSPLAPLSDMAGRPLVVRAIRHVARCDVGVNAGHMGYEFSHGPFWGRWDLAVDVFSGGR